MVAVALPLSVVIQRLFERSNEPCGHMGVWLRSSGVIRLISGKLSWYYSDPLNKARGGGVPGRVTTQTSAPMSVGVLNGPLRRTCRWRPGGAFWLATRTPPSSASSDGLREPSAALVRALRACGWPTLFINIR